MKISNGDNILRNVLLNLAFLTGLWLDLVRFLSLQGGKEKQISLRKYRNLRKKYRMAVSNKRAVKGFYSDWTDSSGAVKKYFHLLLLILFIYMFSVI